MPDLNAASVHRLALGELWPGKTEAARILANSLYWGVPNKKGAVQDELDKHGMKGPAPVLRRIAEGA